jgi:hypothetical protein
MAIVNQNPPAASAAPELLFPILGDSLPWVRRMIILGALVLAPALGYLAAKRNPLYALIAAAVPLLLVGVMAILLRLRLAPLLILFVAAFVPISFPTGTGSRLVLSLALTMLFAGLWLVRMWLVEKRFHLRRAPVNVPLLAFMVTVCISLVWSNVFMDPLVFLSRSFPFVQLASAVVMIMLPGALLMAANLLDSLNLLKVMVIIMLVAGVVGLIRQYNLADLPFNVGGLFTMWVITLSAGFAMFGRHLSWVWRGLLLALAGLWVYWGVVVHISWVSGWLPGMVTIVVLTFLRSKKQAVALAIVAYAAVTINQTYFAKSVGAEESESGGTRLAAWEQNWKVTSQHLLFGTGPAGYAAYYMSYFPTEAMATHSNYIDILAETGIVGFMSFVAIFFTQAWVGYRLCRRLKGRGDFTEALANCLLAGTVGCVVALALGDWLVPFAYTQTISGFDHSVFSWVFMGMIIGLDRLTRPGPEAAPRA